MPNYKYEAMDHSGAEVTGTIDAESEAEAQQLIRDQDLFVTKITEEGRKKKKEKDKDAKKPGARKKKRAGSLSARSVPSSCAPSPGSSPRSRTRDSPSSAASRFSKDRPSPAR